MTTGTPEETEADKELARRFGRKRDGTPRKAPATRGRDAAKKPSGNGSTTGNGSTATPATSAPLVDSEFLSQTFAAQAGERIAEIDEELARMVGLESERSRLVKAQEACRQ